ncbi:MAG: hypothetical protein ACTSQS_18270 [Promethearchaeota archaeon]
MVKYHRVIISNSGVLYHSMKVNNGNWTELADICRDGIGMKENIPKFRYVDCIGIGDKLHICAIDESFVIYHIIRYDNGTWSGWENICKAGMGMAENLKFIRCSVAEIRGELHLIALRKDKILFHTIRYDDGRWSGFGDVCLGGIGMNKHYHFNSIDCVGIKNNLHVCAIRDDGIPYHCIGYKTHWTGFGNILKDGVGLPIDQWMKFESVKCAERNGNLDVLLFGHKLMWGLIRIEPHWSIYKGLLKEISVVINFVKSQKSNESVEVPNENDPNFFKKIWDTWDKIPSIVKKGAGKIIKLIIGNVPKKGLGPFDIVTGLLAPSKGDAPDADDPDKYMKMERERLEKEIKDYLKDYYDKIDNHFFDKNKINDKFEGIDSEFRDKETMIA